MLSDESLKALDLTSSSHKTMELPAWRMWHRKPLPKEEVVKRTLVEGSRRSRRAAGSCRLVVNRLRVVVDPTLKRKSSRPKRKGGGYWTTPSRVGRMQYRAEERRRNEATPVSVLPSLPELGSVSSPTRTSVEALPDIDLAARDEQQLEVMQLGIREPRSARDLMYQRPYVTGRDSCHICHDPISPETLVPFKKRSGGFDHGYEIHLECVGELVQLLKTDKMMVQLGYRSMGASPWGGDDWFVDIKLASGKMVMCSDSGLTVQAG